VAEAEQARWEKSREEKDARRSGFKLLKGSRSSAKARRAAAVRATKRTKARA